MACSGFSKEIKEKSEQHDRAGKQQTEGEQSETMQEPLEHPEHLYHTLSEKLDHRYYHTLQDQFEQLMQHHRHIMEHHHLLMEHHQLVQTLFQQVQDAQQSLQDKQHALKSYHQELQRHHHMIEEHSRLLDEHSHMIAAIHSKRSYSQERPEP